jgi:predicted metalloprotease with PDZ domain
LQDTADAAPFLYDTTNDWSNWRRGTDFYEEGELLWLDVDETLRAITKDKKSIEDFCRAFHGGGNGQPELKTYTFEDVVATLNSVAPYDWAGFLRSRLDGVATKTPNEAIEKSGWKLVYNEQPNTVLEIQEELARHAGFSLTVGFSASDEGTVADVTHGGPAYNAGIGPGMKIVAVNGAQFSPDVMRDAIAAAKNTTAPIQLIVANGAQFRTFSVDYHGGLRYPHIERDDSRPDYLGEITHALVKDTAAATD